MRTSVSRFVLAALLIGACAGSTDTGDTSQPQELVASTESADTAPTTETSAAPDSGIDFTETRDPCVLLTSDEVADALGEVPGEGEYQYTPPLHTCRWDSASRQLTLRVWYWESPEEAASSFADWVGDITEVANVGDAAITSDQIELAFISGSIEVGVDLSPDDDPTANEAAALSLGLHLLERLP